MATYTAPADDPRYEEPKPSPDDPYKIPHNSKAIVELFELTKKVKELSKTLHEQAKRLETTFLKPSRNSTFKPDNLFFDHQTDFDKDVAKSWGGFWVSCKELEPKIVCLRNQMYAIKRVQLFKATYQTFEEHKLQRSFEEECPKEWEKGIRPLGRHD